MHNLIPTTYLRVMSTTATTYLNVVSTWYQPLTTQVVPPNNYHGVVSIIA
jgi:hypothetical protein